MNTPRWRFRAGLLALGTAATVGAQDPVVAPGTAAPLFVEIDGLPDTCWVQQPIEVVVRIGVDAAWMQEHAVPLFQQRLDQPFHVAVPWLQAAEDRAVELLPPPAGVPMQRLAVGDRAGSFAMVGHRDVGARRFDLLEVHVRWVPLAAGASRVAPVEVRHAFATRFQDDFLRGREPLDRQEASIASSARTLRVLPLPSGAPAGFTGAVGEFTLHASVATAATTVGASVPLRVEVRGVGNLERFAPMPPPALSGFHVQGVTSAVEDGVRVFVLDLLPLRAGLTAVPPVPFVAFSPAQRTYVTSRSDTVPLRVGPVPAGVALPARVSERVAADEREVAAARAWPRWWVGFAALPLLGLVVLRRAAHRRRARRARASAVQRLTVALAQDPGAALVAFDALLAQVSGLTPFDAEARNTLRARGVDEELLQRLQQWRDGLDAARFGGRAPAAADVLAAVARLP